MKTLICSALRASLQRFPPCKWVAVEVIKYMIGQGRLGFVWVANAGDLGENVQFCITLIKAENGCAIF